MALDQVTDHFRRSEWIQPSAYGLAAEPYPEELLVPRLLPLCRDVLEPLRAELARPLIIIPGGGWRSVEWQHRHGGPLASRHCHGDAADVRALGLTGEELHGRVLELWRAGRLPALGGLGLYPGRTWCHLDARPHRPGELAQWTGSGRG